VSEVWPCQPGSRGRRRIGLFDQLSKAKVSQSRCHSQSLKSHCFALCPKVMLQLKQEEKDGAGEVQEIALKDVIEWFEQLTPDEVAWLGPGIAF